MSLFQVLAGSAAGCMAGGRLLAGGALPPVRQVQAVSFAPGLVQACPRHRRHLLDWWRSWRRSRWCWRCRWQLCAQVLVQVGAQLGRRVGNVPLPVLAGLVRCAGAVAVRHGQGQQCSVAGVVGGRCRWWPGLGRSLGRGGLRQRGGLVLGFRFLQVVGRVVGGFFQSLATGDSGDRFRLFWWRFQSVANG